MKARAARLSIALCLILLFSMVGQVGPANADTVAGNVFLQGTYVEIGIQPNGSFGSLVDAPAGFHPHMVGNSHLGFVADYDKDGWAVGSPAYGGDYFVPGTPWEGFGVECTGGAAQNGGSGPTQIPTTVALTEGAPGLLRTATWTGEVAVCGSTLRISHYYYLDPSWTYMMVDTTITNIGAAPVTSLSFGRGLDPDNEQTWPPGGFPTTNQVIFQPGSIPDATSTRAVVQASGVAFPGMRIILGANDIRARANAQNAGFSIFNATALTAPTIGPVTADVAMQIAFDLGTLAVGGSASMSYYYGFNATDIGVGGGGPTLTGIAPNSGPIAGGTTVIITGTNLMGGTFTFGGIPAVCTVDPAGTSATCTTPAHAAGPVDVAVTTLAGTVTLEGAFTYIGASAMPATGFAPGVTTVLPAQPAELAYARSDLWLEIPSLGVQANIVGVPMQDGDWNVAWLGQDVGWLNGTAFPTWEGNSVLTAHVYDSYGQAGPFLNLRTLAYDDRIVVHAYGQEYVFAVRNSRLVSSDNPEYAFRHLEGYSYLTLVTCQGYNADTGEYRWRRVVRAVLVDVR